MNNWHQLFGLLVLLAIIGFALTLWSSYWLVGLVIALVATAAWLIRQRCRFGR